MGSGESSIGSRSRSGCTYPNELVESSKTTSSSPSFTRWPELVGPADRSLVHWLRRLVFRSAWLDQRVKEGELDVVFDDSTNSFGYVQPERDREPIELSPEPNWRRVAYGGRR